MSLKHDTNEPIYETGNRLRTRRADLWWPRGRVFGEGWSGMVELVSISKALLLHILAPQKVAMARLSGF